MLYFFSDRNRGDLCLFAAQHRSFAVLTIAFLVMALGTMARAGAQGATSTDVLVLSNGDTLHGKLVNSSDGKITFHSDPLGDISVGLDKVREFHTSGSYAVIDKTVK